ncbi:hypothetical protein LTR84_009090 [Exophiala bonariae]|uniref:beta-glucosidase n=1 Tax=Exophiala bonariae TaxID=1690606 RepID=A0AAV9MZC0_9EURO|nr:hypothetical protein LTR84_009090 [Exophiala bonariae]
MDIEHTLSELTLEEKVGLLSGVDFWHTKAIPRLNIPALRMSDGPNGIRGSRLFNGVPAACFPCGTALGATWDTALLRTAGEMMGREAIAKCVSIVLGPTINIQRTPLGGRGFESYSEDPVLSGDLAAALVVGIQSTGVIAAIKHFVCNDQEEKRQRSNSIITARALREVYLMPFQIAEKKAKPKAYMTAYNKVNGVHASENTQLLRDILRGEWKFDGLVLSDWYGTYSVAEALSAGLDIEMPGPSRWRGSLAQLSVSSGKITESVIDDRVRAVLRTIDRVAPLGIKDFASEGTIDNPETEAKLRDIAVSSIVLLKNSGKVLPLSEHKTTAVIGPNAMLAAYSGGGSAQLRPHRAVSPFEGIRARAKSVRYAQGATNYKKLPMLSNITFIHPNNTPGMEMRVYHDPPSVQNRRLVEAFNITDSSCFLNDYTHPTLHTNLFYVEVEGMLMPEADSVYLFSLTVNGTAKLYVNGKLVVDNETKQQPGDSFFGSGTAEEIGSMALHKGEEYKILVQFATAPTSKVRKTGATQMGLGGLQIGGCPVTDAESLLFDAVNLAKEVDQVIVCIGLNSEWESEGWDRQNMDLPPGSNALVNAIAEVNPNLVVINQSGTPVTMPWVRNVPAILQAWYGGNETGNAIADVLFGHANPGGKLPLSWPIRVQDNPAFVNTQLEDGNVTYGEGIYVGYRWYDKIDREILFPFGHGLSYTEFQMSQLSVEAYAPVSAKVSGNVANIGHRSGSEVVQVYLCFPTSMVPRPVKELKAFTKLLVASGETEKFEIELDLKYACSYWSELANAWVLEKGTYHVLVGSSSQKITLAGTFDVAVTSTWTGI